jgi:hypothetical protein
MNDTFKSLDRTYNQRDIREREGSRGTIEPTETEIDGERRGTGDSFERRGGRRKQAQQPSAELS